jgi:hypothetical protein
MQEPSAVYVRFDRLWQLHYSLAIASIGHDEFEVNVTARWAIGEPALVVIVNSRPRGPSSLQDSRHSMAWKTNPVAARLPRCDLEALGLLEKLPLRSLSEKVSR